MVDLWSGEADKDTVEGAEECADPFFDLGDTYAGYYLMPRKVGLDSPRGHSLGMGDDLGLVDNQFDPCAPMSYAVVSIDDRVGRYNSEGKSEPSQDHGEAVLFFAGEDLAKDSVIKIASRVEDVDIEGTEATVTYAEGQKVSYSLDGDKLVVGDGLEKLQSDYDGYDDAYLDFERALPGSDGGRPVGLGNVNVKPWDENRDELVRDQRSFRIPARESDYVCRWENFSLVCAAEEGTPFPSEADFDLTSPSDKAERAASIQLTMPFGVFPKDVDDSFFHADEALQDEQVTAVGTMLFDTRGDGITLFDGHVGMRFTPDGPKKVPVEHSLTRKYWPDPTELDSFNEAG